MNIISKNFKSAFILVLGLVIFGACSDSNQTGIKLNAKVQSETQTQKANSLADNVVITEAKFRFDEVEFESDVDSIEFERGPLVLSLNLSGELTEIGLADVPAGIYEELEFEIDARDDDEELPNDPDLIGPNNEDYSLVIKGTINGEPFTFASVEDFEIELEFNPPVEVNDSEEVSVTLAFDASNWFLDDQGNALDINNEEDRERVEENIENSLEAFEDDDEDGEEDDDGDDD